MLLVSFTRTAVAELRDRIVLYAVAGDRARSVRISTIDSHAWSLRVGSDDEPIPKVLGNSSYDLSIEKTVELFRKKDPGLCDFMSRLEHLIIDEAQDVMGVRTELVLELLRSLSLDCGVTILADSAQAIYGFTVDEDDEPAGETSLLARLENECPRKLVRRELKQIHRVENDSLVELFVRTRKEVKLAQSPNGYVARVQHAIRESCGKDVGVVRYSSIADFLNKDGESSMLVLFRRRADVLFVSSYCSQAEIQHRLRMSGLPLVVRPWIGWLFGEYVEPYVTRESFSALWESRASSAPQPFEGESQDACWDVLHRLSAGKREGTIDLVQFRRLVSQQRPPVDICYPEVGSTGPILGTIHASKGREADTVVIVMPPPRKQGETDDDKDDLKTFEEGRVYYVGATRARKMLIAAGSNATRVKYLGDSKRVFRQMGERRAQFEVGRSGDVDRIAHLAWSTCLEGQLALASSVGRTMPVEARTFPEQNYAIRIILEQTGSDRVTRLVDIGQMSRSFKNDLGNLWGIVDPGKKLRPAPDIRNLYLAAVSTVGLSEVELGAVKPPFDQSGFALAPVVKGFPMIQFLYRKGGKPGRFE